MQILGGCFRLHEHAAPSRTCYRRTPLQHTLHPPPWQSKITLITPAFPRLLLNHRAPLPPVCLQRNALPNHHHPGRCHNLPAHGHRRSPPHTAPDHFTITAVARSDAWATITVHLDHPSTPGRTQLLS
ncbi:hypothetical protein DFP72DRAFT_1062372 [Ephemerocybe angulata]|uniref:Uncharacterized protein n=1 Tax=Ephemerocybe angulata TaxID=980116 RepID=A0A8H6IBW7_9AGAR|nr:hypothetical protein DFP72DRAFT_1062372 [Tulosesus angulatus]